MFSKNISHNIAVAGLLSLILPGLGEIYNHQWIKGVAILLLTLTLSIIPLIGFPVNILFRIFSVIDSVKIGSKIAGGYEVKPFEFFWQ
ncbi:MAG: hypothetical protein J6W00_08595 [Lentisphaeria bacterium]|nr:hypothetical protein [Lentisphaeria bacterium]